MKKRINWGILASGKIAEKFASDLKLVENSRLVAVASRDLNKSRKFAKKYGALKAYGSYNELVSDADVDVVYIASPHSFHFEHTGLCLNNNKHVLCEKPMGMNNQEINLMANLAQSKNLFLMEALWTRFIPSFNKCKELIERNKIGKIQHIQADFGFKANSDPVGRLLNKKLGGGALLDIGIYPVFLALTLLGEPEDIAAMAIFGKTGVDLTNSIIFNYSSKSAMATLSSTFSANTAMEAIISGTEGRIKLLRPWHAPTSIELTRNEKTKKYLFDETGFGYQYEIKEVNSCLLKGKTQSEVFSINNSKQLHNVLDTIRKQIGLQYAENIK
jgi:predicted dehydrogenase